MHASRYADLLPRVKRNRCNAEVTQDAGLRGALAVLAPSFFRFFFFLFVSLSDPVAGVDAPERS